MPEPSLPVHVICTDPPLLSQATNLLRGSKRMFLNYGSAREGLALIDTHTRGCLLVDHVECQRENVDWLARCKEKHVVAPTVYLVEAHDVDQAVFALKNGAYDAMERTNIQNRLIAAIDQAIWHDGENGPTERFRLQMQTKLESLTAEELQVLEHVMQGRKHSEISQLVNRCKRTVENRSSQILTKMGVESRHQLTRLVMIARGVVRIDSKELEVWTSQRSKLDGRREGSTE